MDSIEVAVAPDAAIMVDEDRGTIIYVDCSASAYVATRKLLEVLKENPGPISSLRLKNKLRDALGHRDLSDKSLVNAVSGLRTALRALRLPVERLLVADCGVYEWRPHEMPPVAATRAMKNK